MKEKTDNGSGIATWIAMLVIAAALFSISAQAISTGTLIYFNIASDAPPTIQYVSPTPNNGTYNTTQIINVTAADSNLTNITIIVNGTAVTVCGASPCNYTLTNEGNYTVYAIAYDNMSNSNSTETRNIVIDKTPPRFLTTGVSPYAIINGSNVSLYVNSTGFDYLWATVRRPDGSKENVTLTNDANTIYMNTSLLGIYNVTFYAADLAGNTETREDYFEAFRGILLDLNVTNSSILGINSTFISYYRNGTVALNQSAIGHYVIYVPNTTLDLEFYAYSNRIVVTTYNIDIIDAAGKYVGMDVHYNSDGFLVTYGAEPQWTVTDGKVRIKYDNLNYTNEDNLRLYKCDDFNFTEMNCTGTWNDVTPSSTQNKPQYYFEILVTGFSGFSIKEIFAAAPQLGGGGGGGGEKVCIEDWKCGPWNSCFNGRQARGCSDLNACGTTQYRPDTEVSCFVPCYTKWNCTEWSACTTSGTQTRVCTDAAQCGTRRGMSPTTQQCRDSCHDGLQNNDEEEIDCGGSCEACKRTEMPTREYAAANILCTLIPFLIILLLVMILLIKASNIEKRAEKIMAVVNVVMMILLLLTMLPISGFNHGACMALADTMQIIDEILLFLVVTFAVMLLEAIIYLLLRRNVEECKRRLREAVKKACKILKESIDALIEAAKKALRRRERLNRRIEKQEQEQKYARQIRKEPTRIVEKTLREEEKVVNRLEGKIDSEEEKTAALRGAIEETSSRIEAVKSYRKELTKKLRELEDNYAFLKRNLLQRLPDETRERVKKSMLKICDGTEQIENRIEGLEMEIKALSAKREALMREQSDLGKETSRDRKISEKAAQDIKALKRYRR
jgi:uncharacterized membrane protein